MVRCVKCGTEVYEHNENEGFDITGNEEAMICWGCYLGELEEYLKNIEPNALDGFYDYLNAKYVKGIKEWDALLEDIRKTEMECCP